MWKKIAVDIFMTIFLALSFIRWDDDATFHYIVGTACAIFFALHICIHWKWIKAVTKSCLKGKLKKSLTWKYIVDMLLLAMWSISIATGILAIGSFSFDIEWMAIFGRIHGVTARIGLVLVIIHIIQHWQQIVSYVVRKKKTT